MNEQIKQENRKAAPRFVLIMVAAVVLGLASSSAALWLRANGAGALASAGTKFLNALLLWLIPALFVLVALPCALVLRRCAAQISSWDGEDECVPEHIERRINYIILFSNLCAFNNMLIMTSALSISENVPVVLGVIAEFLAVLAVIFMQQKKAVDLLKALNPEKHGSVLDLNFQKKWMASCDEAERQRAGEAAYAAFRAVNLTCIVLWCLCMVLDIIFDTGMLPYVLLTVILGVSNTVYCMTEIRSGR